MDGPDGVSDATGRMIAEVVGLVIGGLVAQQMFAPGQPAWGFYEIAGFVLAGLVLLYHGVRNWINHP